jgi:hypothetical protein
MAGTAVIIKSAAAAPPISIGIHLAVFISTPVVSLAGRSDPVLQILSTQPRRGPSPRFCDARSALSDDGSAKWLCQSIRSAGSQLAPPVNVNRKHAGQIGPSFNVTEHILGQAGQTRRIGDYHDLGMRRSWAIAQIARDDRPSRGSLTIATPTWDSRSGGPAEGKESWRMPSRNYG